MNNIEDQWILFLAQNYEKCATHFVKNFQRVQYYNMLNYVNWLIFNKLP